MSSLLFLLSKGNAQIQIIVPNDSIGSDLINATNPSWRLLSTGNSTSSLVNTADFGIPYDIGPNSICANRAVGAGNNRSFLVYFEVVRTLALLISLS